MKKMVRIIRDDPVLFYLTDDNRIITYVYPDLSWRQKMYTEDAISSFIDGWHAALEWSAQ